MPKRPQTIEQQISLRFIEVMGEYVGIGKKFRYKKSFSDAVGMRQQDIHKIEHGGSIQFKHLPKLQQITGINLNWLLIGVGEKYLPFRRSQQNGLSLEERVAKLEKIIAR